MDTQSIKQRFGIIGNSELLNRTLQTAAQVAPTDVSVLVLGESGTGKETIPKIIHHLSSRKHGELVAVNCGAIPEGTIDSELFGHEKGSFTGAHDSRKGYFEVANGGTIFLDEVAELPMNTQVRLLRVLESGEFMRVGSSKVLKTDVRVVAATNINMENAIKNGKFREDLFYRLNQVPLFLPSLRKRKEDVYLLFRKFTTDFGDKYRMPVLQLLPESVSILENYSWPGNIRQLKNVTEQMSILEENRIIDPDTMRKYLPQERESTLPMVIKDKQAGSEDFSEREILYKVLFDMKNDLADVKKLVLQMIQSGGNIEANERNTHLIRKVFGEGGSEAEWQGQEDGSYLIGQDGASNEPKTIEIEETLSLQEKEKELIEKALVKHKNKRKYAARELGISERTLYRKIKEYALR